jgi:uncharacterized RDD family membrane protein YckC
VIVLVAGGVWVVRDYSSYMSSGLQQLGFPHVTVPGQATIPLMDRDVYLLVYESATGSQLSAADAPDLDVVLRDTISGKEMTVEFLTPAERAAISEEGLRALARFKIQAPGIYELAAEYSDGSPEPRFYLYVLGEDIFDQFRLGYFRFIARAALIASFTFVLAVFMGLGTFALSVRSTGGREARASSGGTLAGRGQRFAAALLDQTVTVGVPIAVAAAGYTMGERAFGVLGSFAALLLIAALLAHILLLSTNGQTVGKWMLNLQIVKASTGEIPDPVSAIVIRFIVAQMLVAIVPFYTVIDLLLIFRDDRRCVHDLIAGTEVVLGEQ